MVKLSIKNIKEVDASLHNKINELCSEANDYYNELFKKYDKDLLLQIIFDNSSKNAKVSISLNLKSKNVSLTEENKDALKALTTVLSKFKKAVKKQYELERKDYIYKRKR